MGGGYSFGILPKIKKLTWIGVGMSQDLQIVFTELE
tara:strand:+ start:418 stop:525 length:108 start_codon:yes stop_codon:yes gene_type:complete